VRCTGVALAIALLASTMADARPTRTSVTARNRATVTAFAHLLYDRKQVATAFTRFVAADYVQHNPGIADGRDAAVAALAPMFAQPDARFEVKRILVDGDMAAIHLFGRGDAATPGAAVVDLYRLSHGRIVEHWDVLQPIPATSRNPHPMF